MNKLAIYYVDPIQRRRRKLVRLRPSEEEVAHYLAIGGQRERVRCIGVYGFREETEAGYGPVFDDIIRPGGVRTIRVEQTTDPEQTKIEMGEGRLSDAKTGVLASLGEPVPGRPRGGAA